MSSTPQNRSCFFYSISISIRPSKPEVESVSTHKTKINYLLRAESINIMQSVDYGFYSDVKSEHSVSLRVIYKSP